MNRSRSELLWLPLALVVAARCWGADWRAEESYFAVIVSDLERSQTWYQEVLDLREVSHLTEQGRYDIANLAREGLFVELLELADARQRPEGRVRGPFKVGFLVNDLDAFLAALPETVERPRVIDDDRHELRVVQLLDPDGTILQVMQRSAPGGRPAGKPAP